MNIQTAKEEIKRTLRAYTDRTEDGIYRIPTVQQRPILLIGPPGIGKTAIMAQIAEEESVGLVAYTMTHHTRQSAIGLPMLKERTFQGTTYSVTEYTMSEIVASVYECMEKTGCQSGILFIDEMNCVSETLTPIMLQLLQNKSFGVHQIPEGWLIVAAGNPPEYNKSVREFDMVTLDRVRNMTIEADLSTWKQYACNHGIHPSILAFLNVYPDSFYVIKNEHGHPAFVTARGWEDLSRILIAYERNQEPITEELMLQYLQHESVARNFFLFYDLFSHYTKDFASGNFFSQDIAEHTKKADSTECIALASMLFSKIASMAADYRFTEMISKRMEELTTQFFTLVNGNSLSGDNDYEKMKCFLSQKNNALQIKESNNLLPINDKILEIRTLRQMEENLNKSRKNPAEPLEETCHKKILDLKNTLTADADSLLSFIEHSYGLLESSASKICLSFFSSDLSTNKDCTHFLTKYVCEAYLRNIQHLL